MKNRTNFTMRALKMMVLMELSVLLITLAVCLQNCGPAPPTPTATATATPRVSELYVLPPPQFFVNLLGREFGPDIVAMPKLGVDESVRIYVTFMWEGKAYIAIFGLIGGEWVPFGVRPVEERGEGDFEKEVEHGQDFW